MTAHRERGSASVLLLAVGLVLLAVGLMAASLGAAHVARHRAQAAADLGALAGAIRVIDGPQVACDRAAEIVTANGGRLTGCVVDGLDLKVTAAVAPPAVPGITRPAVATARAGPIRADDSR